MGGERPAWQASMACLIAVAVAACAPDAGKRPPGELPLVLFVETDPPLTDESVDQYRVVEAHVDSVTGAKLDEARWPGRYVKRRGDGVWLTIYAPKPPDEGALADGAYRRASGDGTKSSPAEFRRDYPLPPVAPR